MHVTCTCSPLVYLVGSSILVTICVPYCHNPLLSRSHVSFERFHGDHLRPKVQVWRNFTVGRLKFDVQWYSHDATNIIQHSYLADARIWLMHVASCSLTCRQSCKQVPRNRFSLRLARPYPSALASTIFFSLGCVSQDSRVFQSLLSLQQVTLSCWWMISRQFRPLTLRHSLNG